MSLNRKKALSPTITTISAMTTTRALAVNRNPPIVVARLVNGVRGGDGSTSRPLIHVGMKNCKAAKRSPMKMVATESTSRGDLANHRTTITSMSRPDTTPPAIASANAGRYGRCHRLFISSTARTAEADPISAMAKLMMRLAR